MELYHHWGLPCLPGMWGVWGAEVPEPVLLPSCVTQCLRDNVFTSHLATVPTCAMGAAQRAAAKTSDGLCEVHSLWRVGPLVG